MDIKQMNILDMIEIDYHISLIFHKYGLDLCKNKNKTISEASLSNNLNPDELIADLKKFIAIDNFIEQNDLYLYIKKLISVLETYLTKISRVHGEKFPELRELLEEFLDLENILLPHLLKEEKILLPLKEKVTTLNSCKEKKALKFMHPEHQAILDSIAAINGLTDNYNLPYDKCPTFKTAYLLLEELENKLTELINSENSLIEQVFDKVEC